MRKVFSGVSRSVLVFCVVWLVGNATAAAQNLPLQIGPINDFAAVLGGKPQREPLHGLIQDIEARFGISVTVLIAERNPFQSVEQYATEIRRAWKLQDNHSVLALYLKQDEKWSFDLWMGSSAHNRVDPNGVDQLVDEVDTEVRRSRLRSAVDKTLEGLAQLLESGPANAESKGFSVDLVWWGTILGLPMMALVGAVRWLRSFCPGCTKKLKRAGGAHRMYCPGCGYRR